MMALKGKRTTATDILKRRYYKDEKRQAQLAEARVNAEAARLIYGLRAEAGLSQKQLADLIGTTQSVISRLGDDDYNGHSLSMISKIAIALNKRLVLKAVEL
jgi:ribosome-binding protein aMBF1 (putative translation factor)